MNHRPAIECRLKHYMVIKNRSQNQRSDFKSTIKNVEHSISLQNMSALEQTSFDVIF